MFTQKTQNLRKSKFSTKNSKFSTKKLKFSNNSKFKKNSSFKISKLKNKIDIFKKLKSFIKLNFQDLEIKKKTKFKIKSKETSRLKKLKKTLKTQKSQNFQKILI